MSGEGRKVLVTGAAGFIASHVADAYLARGDRVWIVDDLSTGARENLPPEAEFLEMSVEDPSVGDLIRDEAFDVINHHAAQIDVRRSVDDPIFDARVNLLGLLNLAEAAVDAGTKRFIFVSSGGVVYGKADEIPTPETATKKPESPYGVSKLTGELYLRCYAHLHGLDYVALRYGNVYGPRQNPHGEAGVVAIFCNRLQAGEGLTIFGDGDQTRDYVYVADVVAANMLVTEMAPEEIVGDSAASGEEGGAGSLDARAFNVGTGRPTSVNVLADLLEEEAGRRPGRSHAAERPGELRHSTLNIDKLSGAGWTPTTDLRDGLGMTYRHIAEGAGQRTPADAGGAS